MGRGSTGGPLFLFNPPRWRRLASQSECALHLIANPMSCECMVVVARKFRLG